jgi:Leucine-rich repeat (LRR) protein
MNESPETKDNTQFKRQCVFQIEQSILNNKQLSRITIKIQKFDVNKKANALKMGDWVDLSQNDIRDYDLQHLKFKNNITEINLHDNRISTPGYLTLPKNLKELDLSYNFIRELRGLRLPEGLEKLNLSSNEIQDLNGFDIPETLKELRLTGNKLWLADLEDLKLPKSLEALFLFETGIEDTQLENLKLPESLKEFCICCSGKDPSKLKLPKSLEKLSFSSDMEDPTKLNLPPNLINLDLGHNKIQQKYISNWKYPDTVEYLWLYPNYDLNDLTDLYISKNLRFVYGHSRCKFNFLYKGRNSMNTNKYIEHYNV